MLESSFWGTGRKLLSLNVKAKENAERLTGPTWIWLRASTGPAVMKTFQLVLNPNRAASEQSCRRVELFLETENAVLHPACRYLTLTSGLKK